MSIAQTSIKITTDATGARTGLAQFGAHVKDWAAKQQQALGGMGNAALRGGVIGGFLGSSLQGLLQDTIKETTAWVSGLSKAKAELQSAEVFLASINRQMEKAGKLADEFRAGMSSSDRLTSIDEEIEKLRTQLTGLGNDRRSAMGRMNALFDPTGENLFMPGLEDLRKTATDRVNQITDAMKAPTDRLNELQQRRHRMLNPAEDPKLLADIDKAIREQRDRAVTAGMDAGEKLIFGFQQANAPEAMIKMLREAVGAADLAEHRLKNLPAAGLGGWLGPALAIAGQVGQMRPGLLNTDNAALAAGSTAEVSARNRHTMGIKSAEEQQLAEARQANQLLGDILDAIAGNAADFGQALLPL